MTVRRVGFMINMKDVMESLSSPSKLNLSATNPWSLSTHEDSFNSKSAEFV